MKEVSDTLPVTPDASPGTPETLTEITPLSPETPPLSPAPEELNSETAPVVPETPVAPNQTPATATGQSDWNLAMVSSGQGGWRNAGFAAAHG
jgi:hypothetical protein